MYQAKDSFLNGPFSPTFHPSRHHHPLGGMGWAFKKVRTILLSCGSQARGLGDPAMKGCGRAFSRARARVGGFAVATVFCEVQTQRMSGTFMWSGFQKGDLGAFQDSSRLIPLQSHFRLCVLPHRGPK